MIKRSTSRAAMITTAVYCLLVIVFTIYWANNFSIYVQGKGDEFFYFLAYLLGLTILYHFFQLFQSRQWKLLALSMMMAIMTVITSIFLGVLIFLFLPLNGFPRENIYMYGAIYALTNILLARYIFSRSRNTKGKQRP